MNKSSFFIVLFWLFFKASSAQYRKDSASLHQFVLMLNKAMVDKDEKTLNKMLSNKLTYGHSNGWVEHKKELIENLFNGKLSYSNIELTKTNIAIDENVGAVRSKGTFEVILEGKPLSLKLNVLQVWIWKKGKWILMSRQSVKMDD